VAVVAVQCPDCGSREVVKYGQQPNGQQRYRCNNPSCQRWIFLQQYHNTGWELGVKQQMVDMAINSSGIRYTARVLRIHPMTVNTVLKKSRRTVPRQLRVAPPFAFTRRQRPRPTTACSRNG